MSLGSTLTAASMVGLLGMMNRFDEASEGTKRLNAGLTVAAGVVGLPMGLAYPRSANYTVTAGDARGILVSSVVGAGAGLTLALLPKDVGPAGFGIVTAGMLAGAVVGDRVLVRRFDHSQSEGWLLALGAAAGSLMGFAFDVAAQPDNEAALALFPTAGAILGLAITEGLVTPARAGDVTSFRPIDRGRSVGGPRGSSMTRAPARVSFSPTGAAFAAAGVRGRFPIVSVQF
jgi:hypothetical protein